MEPDVTNPSPPPGPPPPDPTGAPPDPTGEIQEPSQEAQIGCGGELNRDQILRDLKGKLQESQKEADRLKKLAEKLQTDVDSLQKTSQEIDSVVDGYRKDYRRIRSDLGTFRCWFDQKYAELSDSIPAHDRQEVARKRKEVDDYIALLDRTVRNLAKQDELRLAGGANDSVQYAEIQVTNAATGPGGADDKAKAYEALKSFYKQVLDDLKKLEGWKKDVEDAIVKEKPRVAWFLLLDFQDLLGNLETRVDETPPHVLSRKLDHAWCELVNARRRLLDAEATRNARVFNLETTKKALEEARKTRRDRILEAIGRA